VAYCLYILVFLG